MERNFHNDFERFLKENADQYRMYPSENVWKGVYQSLHGKRRWIAIFASFLLLIGGLTAVLLINNKRLDKTGSITATTKTDNSATSSTASSATEMEEKAVAIPSADQHRFAGESVKLPDEKGLTVIAPAAMAPKTLQIRTRPVINPALTPDVVNQAERASGKNETGAPSSITALMAAPEEIIVPAAAEPLVQTQSGLKPSTESELKQANPAENIPTEPFSSRPPVISPDELLTQPALQMQSVNPDEAAHNKSASATELKTYTPESVKNTELANKTLATRSPKRLSLQLSFAPTVSYRKLTENKSFIRDAALQNGGAPNYAYFEGINDAVTHKPELGFEAGLLLKYPLTKRLHVKAGLQLNVTRYSIRAFNYPGAVTTIALNTGNPADALNTYSTYSNIGGNNQDWLQNLYLQASAPIGLEYRIGGNKNVSYGIAGTIQPTHILTERAYLLSTDFKNYAEVPWLIRRWNMNASLEAFVSYNTGKLKWQVGPQVRRQLNSSFINAYPVKEFPMDYGLKVGVQLNK